MTDRVFGDSGNNIVVEEFLTGPEVSGLAFTDAKTLISRWFPRWTTNARWTTISASIQAVWEPLRRTRITQKKLPRTVWKVIFLPTMRAMNKEGRPFCGCLYFGLMLTADGPKVIEYNCPLWRSRSTGGSAIIGIGSSDDHAGDSGRKACRNTCRFS